MIRYTQAATRLPEKRCGIQGFRPLQDFAPHDLSMSEIYPACECAATWEHPRCTGCGGECAFTDGFCQPCWIAYTECPPT